MKKMTKTMMTDDHKDDEDDDDRRFGVNATSLIKQMALENT
jgi:hypothetical protein